MHAAQTGLWKEDADIVVDTLVAADARGVYSHGVLLDFYVWVPLKTLECCADVTAKVELIYRASPMLKGNPSMH